MCAIMEDISDNCEYYCNCYTTQEARALKATKVNQNNGCHWPDAYSSAPYPYTEALPRVEALPKSLWEFTMVGNISGYFWHLSPKRRPATLIKHKNRLFTDVFNNQITLIPDLRYLIIFSKLCMQIPTGWCCRHSMPRWLPR